MEALVHFDSSIPIGILGGSAGTTCDAFHMLREAKKSGARAAFYGRKINHAENFLYKNYEYYKLQCWIAFPACTFL